MIVLGLTGSIGMGKSTTSRMFADAGALVWDADAAVHRLYAPGGAAVAPLGEAFPGVLKDAMVDRTLLAQALGQDEAAFKKLEALVHPLVTEDRAQALALARDEHIRVAVLDIPLLFETGGDQWVDAVVVVTADPAVQHQRVMDRPGMTEERFKAILNRQMPDAEKRSRAHFVIDTSHGLEQAQQQVKTIMQQVLSPDWVAPPKGDSVSALGQ